MEVKQDLATVLEAIKTDRFRQEVESLLESISKARSRRPMLPNMPPYKRTWLDRMRDANCFKTEYFIQNAELALDEIGNSDVKYLSTVRWICKKALNNYFK